jgi:serine/threonine protein kinase
MPLTVAQFVARLAASGLTTADEVRGFIAQLPADKQPSDGQGLAREMVRRKVLTEYQAREVFHGRTKGLVYGEYRVLDQIATGGMGQVYKAQHKRMERTVALKVLKENLLESPQAVERFQREVRAAARLDHPNIVAAYDAGEVDGTHYLVLQLVDGTNLKNLVRDHGPLPLPKALDYLVQAALALEYAHAQGVVHRDIKPANLLVDRKGLVKVLDMGLARMEDELRDDHQSGPGRLTVSNQMLGTADYMAPEQAEDTLTADARSDQYALACTLYYLLVGKPPYPGDTVSQTIAQHVQGPVPSLRAARAEVPEPIDAIVRRMFAKRPEDRFASMTELIEALSEAGVTDVNPLATRSSRPSGEFAPMAPTSGGGRGNTEVAGSTANLEAGQPVAGGEAPAAGGDTMLVVPPSGSTAGDSQAGGSGRSATEDTTVYLTDRDRAIGDSSGATETSDVATGESGWWRRLWQRLRT